MRTLLRLLLFPALCFLMLSPVRAQAEESRIVIFHTTDTHGHVATNHNTIGLDLIAGIVKQEPDALLVDAGDFLMGQPIAAMTRGKDIIALMKETGYFAVAVGNHEFDHGPEMLMQRYAEASAAPRPMRMLSANARDKDGNLLFEPEARASVDGVNVCFFGLTTQAAKFSVTPRYIKDIHFDDVMETARSMAQKQRESGCDLVVALSHTGSKKERFATSRDLGTIDGIDLIIDGHSHVQLNETTPTGALLVSAGAHGKHLGRVEIHYDKDSRNITRMENTLISPQQASVHTPDAAVGKKLDEITARLDKELARVVGGLEHSLNGSRTVLRTREAPLGNLFADVVRATYPCDMALINAGGLRTGLRKGEVTVGDIVAVVPFRDQVVTVKVSGRELREILEFGFSGLPEEQGFFPQISGMVVRVDPNNNPGERVLSLALEDGVPIEPDREYILATNDYVAKGGDGYPVLQSKTLINAGKNSQQAAIDFFGGKTLTQYQQGPAARIIFVTAKGSALETPLTKGSALGTPLAKGSALGTPLAKGSALGTPLAKGSALGTRWGK